MTCRKRPRPASTFTQEGGVSTPLANPSARRAIIWARPYMQNNVTKPITGAVLMGFSNAGGFATEGRGWQAAFKRYCMWSRSQGGNVGTAYHTFGVGFPFYPLLDPSLPAVPVIVRMRDVVQVTLEAGAQGWVSFVCGGGFLNQDLAKENYRSIGFSNYAGNTWCTYCSGNANAAAQHVVDTGRLISDVVELMVEIDGAQKQARYYIDGALVDTFSPPVDNAAIAFHRKESIYWSNLSNFGASTIRFHHGLGIGPLVEVETLS